METYKDLYLHMANAVAKATEILIKAQLECEEAYLSFPSLEHNIIKIKENSTEAM